MAPSRRLFAWSECYHQRKLTQGDSTLLSQKARLSVGSGHSPALRAKGALGWAAGLPDTQRRWCQAQDRPLWENVGQSQVLGMQRAQADPVPFCRPHDTSNQASGSANFTITLTEGQYFPQERLMYLHCLVLCPVQALSGPLPFHSIHSIAGPGTPNTGSILEHWAESIEAASFHLSGATSNFPSPPASFAEPNSP